MNRRFLLKNLALSAFVTPTLTHAKPSRPFVRFAHVTDVHLFPFFSATKGFERCLHHLQSLDVKPDFIINGGDAVLEAHQASLNVAQKQWKAWHGVLKDENSLPLYHCLGNHDIWCKDNTESAFIDGKKLATEQLEMPKSYYALEQGNWKIIVLDSVQKGEGEKWYAAVLDAEQMNWLKQELKNTPAAIRSHPIARADFGRVCLFDGKRHENKAWRVPDAWMHADMRELTDLFYEYPNVKLALSGHIHLRDVVEYNGVTYCCNGAVSGAWWTGRYQQTAQGYAVVDLYDDGTFKNQYVSYKNA